jgi:hypothetical protein
VFPFNQLNMEAILSICLGIGLSAACGFRVFVPFLVMSIAHLSGHLPLAHGMEWIGTPAGALMFSVATIVEIGGYFIPWIDHLLDVLATPSALVAGTLITGAMIKGGSPMLRWSIAAIAGGGTAGIVQGVTVLARGASTATTGGFANPLFATVELSAAVIIAIFAIIVPVLVAGLVLFVIIFGFKKILRWWNKRSHPKAVTRPPVRPQPIATWVNTEGDPIRLGPPRR